MAVQRSVVAYNRWFLFCANIYKYILQLFHVFSVADRKIWEKHFFFFLLDATFYGYKNLDAMCVCAQ